MAEKLLTVVQGSYCALHSDHTLNIFCKNCLEFICQECTITLHQGHNYRDEHASSSELAVVGFVDLSDEQHVGISPENSYASGDGLQQARVDEQAVVVVKTMNVLNKEYTHQTNITAELVHCKSLKGNDVLCEIQKQRNGQYKVTYHPTKRGKHQLHIKISGREIKGSPFTVAVTSSPQSLGGPIRVITNLSKPNFVTTNHDNHIIVVENVSNCVSVLDLEGKKILSFGSQRSNNGQLLCPTGVAVDIRDNIYVVDNNNHRIQKFTSDGVFLKSVGTPGSGELCFRSPMGVCFHPSNHKLYVCDQGNHRIQVLSTDLTFRSTFGREGSGNGEFQYPRSAACNSKGQIYVTDCSNHRVQIFDENGTFLQLFENKDDGEKLQYPYGIAIDSSNTVFVSERYIHCVSVFTAKGEYIMTFGCEGEAEGQFIYPNGLCIDQYDNIFVCDMTNCRIQIF